MKSLRVVVLLAGCGFESASPQIVGDDARGSGDATVDARPDAMIIPPDARTCFGRLVNICLASLPTNAVTFSGQPPPLDTGSDSSCTQIVPQTGGPSLCVIAAKTITVAGSLAVIGPRPLVLIGTETVSVPGILDASSTLVGARRGAGANTGGCATNGITGQSDTRGGGGGAGGSFGTAGGNGGNGDINDNGEPPGIADGGTAGPAITPTLLRGGCNGGRGGDSDAQHRGGVGGDGGGAVYLIAGTSITIAGDMFASGAGGGATSNAGGIEQGGGGGGAGGMIVLDAPTIDASGRLVANGGAGGGGGGLDSGGTSGGDGTTINWDQRAAGGSAAEANGGDGADGTAIGKTNNITGTSDTGGAGGGAGGLGLVWVYGTLQNATKVSPAPTQR